MTEAPGSSFPKPIHHSYWVVDGKFLAGEYPRNKSGEDAYEKLDALQDAGVTLFVDLTEEGELLAYANRLESAGHLRFPIPDSGTPRSWEQTRDILDAIDGHLSKDGKVYLHCWGGIGRTGTIVGCWLARHGYPGDAALTRLDELWKENPKSSWRGSPENPGQIDYVRNWRE